MLGSLGLNGVGRDVECTDVVTVNNGGMANRVELAQKRAQPAGFSDAIGHCTILDFSTRLGHYWLALGGP
jgi:hypothetical protein